MGEVSATYIAVVLVMTACIPNVPTSAALVVTLKRPPPVEADDQALRLPDSNLDLSGLDDFGCPGQPLT